MKKRKLFNQLVALILTVIMTLSLIPSEAIYAEDVATDTDAIAIDNDTEETTEVATEIASEVPHEESTEEVATEAGDDFKKETTENETSEPAKEKEESEESAEIIPTFDHLYDGVPVAGKDFSGCELLIGTADAGIFTRDTEVVSEYNGIYLTRYADVEQTKSAYTYYYNRADIVEVNGSIKANDEDYVEEPTEEAPVEDTKATEDEETDEIANDGHGEADLSSLNTGDDAFSNMSNTSVGNYSGAIALIDTGASGSNIIGSVSVLGGSASDDNGHGSTLANAIAEANPNAKILSIKALNSSAVGAVSDVYTAIEYAIQSHVAVINLSVCSIDSADSQLLRNAIAEAIASGITVVVSAGNNSSNAGYYTPANINSVFTIGACDSEGNRIDKSNFGSVIDYYVVADSTSVAAAKFSAYIVNGLDSATSKEDVFTREYVESEKEPIKEEAAIEENIKEEKDEEESYSLPTNKDKDGFIIPGSDSLDIQTPTPSDISTDILVQASYDTITISEAETLMDGAHISSTTRPSGYPATVTASGVEIHQTSGSTGAFSGYAGEVTNIGGLSVSPTVYQIWNSRVACHSHLKEEHLGAPGNAGDTYSISNATFKYIGNDSDGWVYYGLSSTVDGRSGAQHLLIILSLRTYQEYVGIHKTDSRGGQNISGVVFDIYSSQSTSSTKLGTITTGSDGTGKAIWSTPTAHSTVYAYEKSAPFPYTNNAGRWFSLTTYSSEASVENRSILNAPLDYLVSVFKSPTISDCTYSKNPNYNLDGTKFAIYKNSTNEYVGEIEVNSSGETKSALDVTDYMEPKAGGGYNPTVFRYIEKTVGKNFSPSNRDRTDTFTVGSTSTRYSFSVSNTPVMDPVDIVISKADKTGADSDLSNAQFTVKFYALDASASTTYTAAQLATQTPTKTWVIKTIKNTSGDYEAVLDPTHKVSGDSYYSNGWLPLGWITIQETKAPEGYVLDNTVSVIKIDRPSADIGTINVVNSPIMNANGTGLLEETPIRADFEFTKLNKVTGEAMEGVQFIIRNTGTLEEHTVVTDANGHYSSADTPHSDPDGLWFELNKDMGVAQVDDTLGALPFGHYELEEIRCEANKGYQLEPVREFDVKEADHGTVITVFDENAIASDSKIHDVPDAYLQTEAFCIETQSHTLACGLEAPQTIEDKVWYWYLGSAEEFTLVGKLMVKEADGSFTPYKKLVVDAEGNVSETGEDLVEYMSFTTEAEYQKSYFEQSGEMLMTFNNVMPLKKDEGKAYVVFEYLYKGTWDETNIDQAGEPYLKHEEDIYEQSIYVPKGETEAYNTVNLSKTAYAKNVKLTDVFSYKGLTVGKEYELKTQIYIKEDKSVSGISYSSRAELEGNLVKDANGNALVLTSKFTPSSPNGSTEVSVELDLSKYVDKSFVFLEDVYDEGLLICSHVDINSTPQTIHVPKIKTKARGVGNTQLVLADKETSFTDTISYWNLSANTTYTAVGYMVNLDTGEYILSDDSPLTAITEFTTPAANRENGGVDGTVDVEFSFDGSDLTGKKIVIYEEVYVGKNTEEAYKVSEHKDITSTDQQIRFPKIGTTVYDKEDNDNEVEANSDVTIVDKVQYKNVDQNSEYTMHGWLVYKSTGKDVIINGKRVESSTTFISSTTDGTIDVQMSFNTTGLSGKEIVVYEECLDKDGNKVGQHKDLTDSGQTFKVKKRTTPPKTGDVIPIRIIIFILFGAAAGIVIIFFNKKGKR